jgi:hypothetical protein
MQCVMRDTLRSVHGPRVLCCLAGSTGTVHGGRSAMNTRMHVRTRICMVLTYVWC